MLGMFKYKSYFASFQMKSTWLKWEGQNWCKVHTLMTIFVFYPITFFRKRGIVGRKQCWIFKRKKGSRGVGEEQLIAQMLWMNMGYSACSPDELRVCLEHRERKGKGKGKKIKKIFLLLFGWKRKREENKK